MQIENLAHEWIDPEVYDECKLRELQDTIKDYFEVVYGAVNVEEQDNDKKCGSTNTNGENFILDTRKPFPK